MPIASAQAQSKIAPPGIEVARLHAILRPNAAGQWYVQNDGDHASSGISSTVEQCPGASSCRPGDDFVRIFFDRTYTHAGTIQVTSDDDFGSRVTGHSNLGLNNATIRIHANGQRIDPATVYSYVPQGAGNLWINVTMVNKP